MGTKNAAESSSSVLLNIRKITTNVAIIAAIHLI
jgi:hypothetical protein